MHGLKPMLRSANARKRQITVNYDEARAESSNVNKRARCSRLGSFSKFSFQRFLLRSILCLSRQFEARAE